MTTTILIILLLAVAGGALYGVYRGRRFSRRLSKTMFGTESLLEGINAQEELLSETPKSVSAMTNIYLPLIQQDFPQFNLAEFRLRSENMLSAYLAALDRQDITLLNDASEELKKQARLQLEDDARQERRQVYRSVKIHRTEISGYEKNGGLCTITLQSAVEYYHWITDASGKRLEGKEDRKIQTRYQTELVYIQDIDALPEQATGISVVCPQCGAPIRRLGSKFCEYCGAAVVELNLRVWSLNRIQEVG